MAKTKKIEKKETETKKYVRPSWDEYFIQLTELVGTRGTCDRGRAGSVIVKDKRILSTGYVGAPAGLPSCDEIGHELQTVVKEDGTLSKHCVRTSHAEQNAINNAARVGTAIEGATLYCKMTPCYKCAQSIINSGIKRVVAAMDYHAGERTKEIFKKAGIEFVLLKNDMLTYANMK